MTVAADLTPKTAEKLSELSGIPVGTLRDWARKGVIPARKVGKDWLFSPLALYTWLDEGGEEQGGSGRVPEAPEREDETRPHDKRAPSLRSQR